MTNKGKFMLCIIGIVLVTLLIPDVVTRYMSIGRDSVALTTAYYAKFFAYNFSAHLGLVYLAFLSYVVFVKNAK